MLMKADPKFADETIQTFLGPERLCHYEQAIIRLEANSSF